MKKYITLLLIIFLPVPLFSQQENEIPVFSGNELVITATRIEMPQRSIGRSISVISSSELENLKTISVADLLRNVPGLNITQNGGTGQPASLFMRGAKSGHTLVMIDGIEMNDPILPGRSFDFAHLLPDGIERIEIIKGPQSTLYGSDAIGGVINIISKKGIKKPSFLISGESGSYGTYKENIRTSGAYENFNYNLSLSRLDAKGFSAAGEKYGNIEKDGYGSTSLSGKTGINLSKITSFNLIFHYINTKTDMDNTGGTFGDDPNYTTTGKQFYLKNQLIIDTFNKKWTQIYSFSFMNNRRNYLNEKDSDHPEDFIESSYNSSSYKFDFQNNVFANEMNTLAFGLEYEKEKGDSRYHSESTWGPYEVVFPNNEADILGFYIHDNMNINNTFLPTFGFRLDRHNKYGSSATFHVAPVYFIGRSNTKLRASIATGFKAPSLYQLYSQYGDETLKPEKVKSFDIGFEQYLYKDIISLSAEYFYNDFNNLIDFESNLYKYVNIGSAFTNGIEIETAARPLKNLYLKLYYTRLNAEDKTAKEKLLRRAKNKAGITANYLYKKLNLNLNMLFVGKRDDMDYSSWPPQRIILKEYTKINLTASYNITQTAQVFAKIENLTNQDYEDVLGFGTPKRAFYFGFKLNY